MKEKIQYFPDVDFPVFNIEASKIIPYLQGKGIEVGSGDRGVLKGNIRVDIDKKVLPDICCNCEKLPIENNKFDYLVAMHILEHLEDQAGVLREWRRVIKYGGLIVLVHPDVLFTGKQKPLETNPDKNPFNQHTFERSFGEFLDWFNRLENTGLVIKSYDFACRGWSFYIIFEKIKF